MHYLFIDESGDHGLSNIDKQFPVFVLCGLLISEEDYRDLSQKVNALKMKFWGDKRVIFHSTDIRRWRKEFSILFDPRIREMFYKELNDIISESNFTIVSSVISKEAYIAKYGKTGDDIYQLSLSFLIERSVFYLDKVATPNETLKIIIEKRGKKEDTQLSAHFHKIRDRGTYYVTPVRIQSYKMNIDFKDKKDDDVGLQISDLVAYPIATYVIDPDRANPAFDLIKDKFYMNESRTKMFGLKHFP